MSAGRVFVYADDGMHGRELWKSDGTAAGTVLVKDIRSGRATSNDGRGGQSFAVLGDVLYFTASADHVAYDDWVDELWKSDGTTAGTVKVADLAQYGANTDPFSLFAGDVLYLSNSGDSSRAMGRRTERRCWPSDARPRGLHRERASRLLLRVQWLSYVRSSGRATATAVGTVVVRTFFVPGFVRYDAAHLTDMRVADCCSPPTTARMAMSSG